VEPKRCLSERAVGGLLDEFVADGEDRVRVKGASIVSPRNKIERIVPPDSADVTVP